MRALNLISFIEGKLLLLFILNIFNYKSKIIYLLIKVSILLFLSYWISFNNIILIEKKIDEIKFSRIDKCDFECNMIINILLV